MRDTVRVEVASRLRVSGPPELIRRLQARLTLRNPEHVDRVKRGLWTGKTPEWLRYYRPTPDGVECPRGALSAVRELAQAHRAHLEIADRSRTLPELDLAFNAELRPYQAEALRQVEARRDALLVAPTGAGKTVMALAVIAARRQPALVIVHTGALQEQWIERIQKFAPGTPIGRIGGGRCEVAERGITVAVVNSLSKHAHEVAPHVGHLLVDEAHRAVAPRFARTIGAFDARYRLGLTATAYRRDGLTPVLEWLLGERVEVDRSELVETGALLVARYHPVETAFTSSRDGSSEYQALLSDLVADDDRNALVARWTALAARKTEGVMLVLSDRKAHLEALRGHLEAEGTAAVVITGETSPAQREDALRELRSGQARCLLATAQLLGEGLDMPTASVLVLASPMKWRGRLVQAVGRILRPAPGKDRAVVIDVVDPCVPVLQAQAKSRRRTFERELAA